MDKRSSFLQRFIIGRKNAVRVVARQGHEELGSLLDISHKGFRMTTRQKFAPGAPLNGLIEFSQTTGVPHMIPFKAQCMWVDGRQCGFSLQDLPMAEEPFLDELIERVSSDR